MTDDCWSVVIVEGRLAYSPGLWMRLSYEASAQSQVRALARIGVQAAVVHADLLGMPTNETVAIARATKEPR